MMSATVAVSQHVDVQTQSRERSITPSTKLFFVVSVRSLKEIPDRPIEQYIGTLFYTYIKSACEYTITVLLSHVVN